jgi:hypothetical protein
LKYFKQHQKLLTPSVITYSDNATLHVVLLNNNLPQRRTVIASKSYGYELIETVITS